MTSCLYSGNINISNNIFALEIVWKTQINNLSNLFTVRGARTIENEESFELRRMDTNISAIKH